MSVNVPLFDVLTRHQIYIEGVKTYASQSFANNMAELELELRKLLNGVTVSELGELTRYQLGQFIAQLREIQKKFYSQYVDDILKFLLGFLKVNVKVNHEIMSAVTDQTVTQADNERDHSSLFGILAATASAEGFARLWALLFKSPMGANGLTPQLTLQQFSGGSQVGFEALLRRAYADHWTVDQLKAAAFGTKELRFNDGQMSRIKRGSDAIIATLIQHVSANSSAAVQSIFSSRYRWISILDNRTTEICRLRSNRIFVFGQGPMPPAHINCRSSIEAMLETSPSIVPPDNFADWIRGQPQSVQNDILGADKADALRQGKVKSAEPRFEVNSALSLEQFAGKVDLMLSQS